MKINNPYDSRYAGKELYWGSKPSAICDRVIELVCPTDGFRPKLLDLGCGEGRNAIHFAKNGFEVVGIEASNAGLETMQHRARELGVEILGIQADMLTYEIDDEYDVIFSTGTLHYLPPDIRDARFAHFKAVTRPNGVNVHSVFVAKPFIPESPDAEPTAHSFKSGELLTYYWDWKILHCAENIFDCNSSGVPHRHACNRIIARKCDA